MAVFSASGAVACGQFTGILRSSASPPPPSQGIYCHSLQTSCFRPGVVHVHCLGDTLLNDESATEYCAGRWSYFVKFSCICSEQRVGLSSWRLSRQPLLSRGLKPSRVGGSKKYRTIKCIRLASVADEVAVKVLDEDGNSSGMNSKRNEQLGDLPALKAPPRPMPRPVLAPRKSPLQASSGNVKEASAQRNGVQNLGGVGSRPSSPLKPETRGPTSSGLSPNVQTRSGASNPVQALDQILKKAEQLGSQPSSQAGNRQGAGRVFTRQNQNQRPPSQTQWRRSKENEEANEGLSSSKKESVDQRQDAGISANAAKSSVDSGNIAQAAEPTAPLTNNLPAIRPPPLMKPKPVIVQRPPAAPQQMPQMVDRKPQMMDKNRRIIEPVRPAADAVIGPAETAIQPVSDQQPQTRRKPILRDIGASPKAAVAEPSTKDVGRTSKAKSLDPLVEAATLGLPSKPAKVVSPKGKEERRGKATEVMDGAKRRGLKVEIEDDPKADDLDADVAAIARPRGRKYTKARRKAERLEAAKAAAPVKVEILEVGKEGMSVQDLAGNLAVNDSEVVKTLFMKGILSTVNQILDEETVKLVCKEFGVEVIESGSLKVEEMAKKTTEFVNQDDESLQVRPPVVTIMGHVDHGKTSLLDYIRKSKVAASEAGGITQGIGAYRVLVPVGGVEQACVFLDTPGHEAFSAMRARGARVTDIAIIVVAADDGVRPQTIEAIAHAKAANVPAVVAINKIDKEGANPDRVMQELSSAGLMPEDWGGDVPMVQVSALTGQNVDQLLETIMLVSEFQDLKANPNRSARGTVIEASLDKTRGPVATFLVQNGTLRKGDVVICGESYGKVRALLDDTGARVNDAGPSTAVQVTGLHAVPIAGDEFEIVDSLDEARQKATEHREAMRDVRLAALAGEGKLTVASLASAVASAKEAGVESHQLNVILKVDVQGSAEAIREALQVLPQDAVQLRFLMQAPGDINASDIDLAIASEAIIIGFKVGLQAGVKARVEKESVEIRLYKVIYDLVEDIRQAMEGLLQPIEEQVLIGKAEVRAIFSSGSGKVAGCMVTEGKLVKGCGVKIMRGSTLVCTSTLNSLRRVKEVAKEVTFGLECGVGVDNFDEWQEGDILEAFNMVAKKKTLEEASARVTLTLSAS